VNDMKKFKFGVALGTSNILSVG